MTLTSHQICVAVLTVASLAVRHGDADVGVVKNARGELLRAARKDFADVSACVWGKRVREPWQRIPFHALCIVLRQRVEALRRACTEELGAQYSAIEHEATKAWAYRASVFCADAPLP